MSRSSFFLLTWALVLGLFSSTPALAGGEGVLVRFQLSEPRATKYYLTVGGYIHRTPWYLPRDVWPEKADREPGRRLTAGQFTPWLDLKKHAGQLLHGRMNRAGGVAEFPNVTVNIHTEPKSERCTLLIELATAPDEKRVVKHWRESFTGTLTSFLVSPNLSKDAAELETAAEMTARRLKWAREATGGKRRAPKELILQTGFWAPQRPELNLQEAEVLHLLGFNVIGNQMPEVRQKYGASFRVPGHTHNVRFDPGVTREEVDALIRKQATAWKSKFLPGVPFGFSDEITAGTIGQSKPALTHFHQWLAEQKIPPADLGVQALTEVQPLETPDALGGALKVNEKAARRIFYYTSRFRQLATTERFRWLTEAFHQHAGAGPLTSTLVADHPYFSGTGLGMGMGPNPAWGRPALAADWFDLARRRAVDLAGIEDWMGIRYMYGPSYSWEGPQLMGFQAAIFRSGSQGQQPIQAWLTPGDEQLWRLKAFSALCQGAKHFFFWTYGPTATSTENYWSDLRGAHAGVASVARQLAAAEHIIAPGKMRKTKVALLYSISSDLWQPFGYVHMLERRGLYLALVHRNILVDLLTEEDIEAGRLTDYEVLYTADPCIKMTAQAKISDWVNQGVGRLFGTCAAGSRNEFNEPVAGLAALFGLHPAQEEVVQPGRYHIRGALNDMKYLDNIRYKGEQVRCGALGVKVLTKISEGRVVGHFDNGQPAAVRKGKTFWVGTCPGMAYLKEAKFVPTELKEQWPQRERLFLTAAARHQQQVQLSHDVVETGVYDAPKGTALVLANFTHRPIEGLRVSLPLDRKVKSVRSLEQGPLQFEHAGSGNLLFQLNLNVTDIVLVE